MKNFHLGTLVVLTLAGLLTGGCKKETNEPQVVTYSVADLAGSYMLTSIKYRAHDTPEEDITDTYFTTCELDNVYELKTDMTFSYVDAGTVCDPEGSYNNTWQLDGALLSFDFYNMTIQKFDGKNLEGILTETQNGHTHTYTYTFEKQ